MKKIVGFFVNHFSERGTEVAVFDYALYNQKILNNTSIIIYPKSTKIIVEDVKRKFQSYFKIIEIDDLDEDKYKKPIYDASRKNTLCNALENAIIENNIKYLYHLKAGHEDGVLSKTAKNLIHCVFYPSEKNKHGDVYSVISKSIGNNKYPVVPHIVEPFPVLKENMRTTYNIPNDAIVFGRHGGFDTFNISYVHETIKKILINNDNIYFLFLNTKHFYEHKRCIYIDHVIIDVKEKAKFINTCDAMIHARKGGETFGLACAEFSILNKPIITAMCGEKAHIDILGSKGIYYNNEKELYNIFTNFQINPDIDYNCYKEFSPEKVMQIFDKLYLQ
uniref:Glycosyl transferase family 1 domain-containing protein n=1 Tax=viral metagenome TaxID=1070528 RepID=A0A6C0BS65_9ZZZZ